MYEHQLSRAEESHVHTLLEPAMNVAIHPAPIADRATQENAAAGDRFLS
jgi:hypothetical protein